MSKVDDLKDILSKTSKEDSDVVKDNLPATNKKPPVPVYKRSKGDKVEKEANIIQLSDFTLHRALIGDLSEYTDKDDEAMIKWSTRNGRIRATAYLSNKAIEKETRNYDYIVIAPFNFLEFEEFMDNAIELLEERVKDTSVKVICYYPVYKNNVKTDDIEEKATVVFGIDTAGYAYMSVYSKDSKKLKWIMEKPKYHKHIKSKDEPVSPAKRSREYAKRYLKHILDTAKKIDTEKYNKVHIDYV